MPIPGFLVLAAVAAFLIIVPFACADESGGEPVLRQRGEASYYADEFQGKPTATGETFSQHKMTAASPDLPLGTKAKVTNEANGKSVEVKINDRGPYVDGRVVDLSKKAAEKLDMKEDGVAPVKVEVKPSAQPTQKAAEKVVEKAQQQEAKEAAE